MTIPNYNTNYAAESNWLFMTQKEWGVSLSVSMLIALLMLPFYSDISLWVGVGILLTTISLFNIVFSSKYMVPYPQLAVLTACIQLILAAWGNHFYPTYHPFYDINYRLPTYLGYAGPVCIFIALGWLIPLLWKDPTLMIFGRETPLGLKIVKELNIIFVIGLFGTLLQPFTPSALIFLMVLLGNMMYVGAFGYTLLEIPGWKTRIGIAMAILFMRSAMAGMVHDLVLWTASLMLIMALRQQWNTRRTFIVVLTGIIGVIFILNIKELYREQFWFGRIKIADSRIGAISKLMLDHVVEPEIIFAPTKISRTLARLNQGWIVNRAMAWTPEVEPYARGKTIVDIIRNDLIPRFLNPDKKAGRGEENYERYTGLKLWGSTSMKLGYAGEMYINFGPKFGLLAVGIYGLILGLGFRWLYMRALRQPFLWAWVPYFATVAIKAESSVGYLANWLIKAIVIMIAVLWFCPVMRQTLLKSLKRPETGEKLKTSSLSSGSTSSVREPILQPLRRQSNLQNKSKRQFKEWRGLLRT